MPQVTSAGSKAAGKHPRPNGTKANSQLRDTRWLRIVPKFVNAGNNLKTPYMAPRLRFQTIAIPQVEIEHRCHLPYVVLSAKIVFELINSPEKSGAYLLSQLNLPPAPSQGRISVSACVV